MPWTEMLLKLRHAGDIILSYLISHRTDGRGFRLPTDLRKGKAMKAKWIYGLALCLMLPAAMATTATAQEQSANTEEARIHFVDHGAIRDWHPNGDKGLWIRANHKQWYYADLMFKCNGLRFANAIGFDTGPVGSFDKFSTVVVDGQRCPVTSVVKSDPPPKA